MNYYPKISIITVVYNNEKLIEQTINSVLEQTYQNIEFLVIDGNSKDNTVPIIKRYLDRIDVFISEPDKGIYDAMNKGISKSSGEFIIFMNSGDLFTAPDVLQRIIKEAASDSDIIYGDKLADYNDQFKKLIRAKPLRAIKRGMIFSHQSLLARSRFLKQYPFDLQYKIAADFDFVFTCFKIQANFQYIPIPIAIISTGGLSEGNHGVFDEYARIISKWDSSVITKIQLKLRKWEIKFRNILKMAMPRTLVQYFQKKSQ
ncbi:glycosyltransferase family 2 protein [Chitinophaga polysaccharea]|uniref:glycosyltransferase family 2 protein n=1 Tax=Chitinophaga polysaccharea TaxID=1293035 RepID=UPI00115BEB03|nr:glycosyltransferase family 2 protein [Chitinophaga polysaccharea]